MVETAALAALKRWMRKGRGRTHGAIARALRVSQPSVTAWLQGACRPEAHNRAMLETLTGGEVRASSWLLPKERSEADRTLAAIKLAKAGM